MEINTKEGIALKIRLVVVMLVLLVATTGCGNLLEKVTKSKDAAQPAATTATSNGQNPAQSQPQEFSITEIQAAVKDGKSVKIMAQDTGASLVLDDTKRKELIKILADSGELKETKELALIVASPEFPAYQIQIEDKNIKLDLYDSIRFGAGNENSRHIFMEKGELAKALNKWLPARTYPETSLGYLFKANKVTVKGDTFTEETDFTPAKNAILRSIRSVQLQSSTLPQDAGEPLKITFTANNKKYTLQVYGEYLVYNNATYKLPNGKQTIQGLLSQG
ncbi:MAG TPA: hypothetical protein VFF14_02010 [Candidatus Deferrimicrobium sp.]|nr:hypothetical protein [Candidatus Deferrimicrobium sp.]